MFPLIRIKLGLPDVLRHKKDDHRAVVCRPPSRLYLWLGALAQLGERLVCNQEVAGSIPVRSIKATRDVLREPLVTPWSGRLSCSMWPDNDAIQVIWRFWTLSLNVNRSSRDNVIERKPGYILCR